MAGLGIHLDYGIKRMILLVGMSLFMVSSLLAAFTVSQTASQGITANIINTTCSLYNTIHAVIFVLGLVLIIFGAALYAGSHVLPGNLKSNAQGYGMGMVVGGIVGVIIALAAPFILGIVTGNYSVASSCPSNTL